MSITEFKKSLTEFKKVLQNSKKSDLFEKISIIQYSVADNIKRGMGEG